VRVILAVLVLLLAAGCASDVAPRAVTEHLRRADELLAAKHEVAASKELDAAIAAAPKRFETYDEVVQALARRGFYREAAEYCGFFLANAEGPKFLGRKLTTQERIALVQVQGVMLEQAGDSVAAARALENALALDPNNAELLNDVGYLYADAGRELPRALALTKRAVALVPGEANFRDSLGWVYYKMGRYEEAEKELRRAVLLSPQSSELRCHLGVLYASWNRRSEARIELAKALMLDPSNSDARAELAKLRLVSPRILHNL
jgi:Tfp pilus assembly protein PilF